MRTPSLSEFDKQSIPYILENKRGDVSWISAYLLRFIYQLPHPDELEQYFPEHVEAIRLYLNATTPEQRVVLPMLEGTAWRKDLWFLFGKAQDLYQVGLACAYPDEFQAWTNWIVGEADEKEFDDYWDGVQKVHSLQEAKEWFLEHSGGEVTCIRDGASYECDCYPAAELFYSLPTN